LIFSGCNELKNDKAPKDGVKIFNSNYVPTNYKVNPKPDSLVAFLWPTEEYFERYNREGIIAENDYKKFMVNSAKEVFLNGDAFDEWSLVFLNEGTKIQSNIKEIEVKIKPILEQISNIQKQIGDFKKQLKTVEKEKKSLTRTKSKLRKKKSALDKLSLELTKEFTSLSCADVINDQAGPNFQRCKEIEQELLDTASEMEDVNEEYDTVLAEISELSKEISRIKKEEISPLFSLKKKIENEELKPLNEDKRPLEDRLDAITTHQAEMLGRVQVALDPHAVSYPTDVDGNPTYNQYGHQNRSIDEEKQVNWLKTYTNTAGQSNLFNIEGNVIHIQFNEWGEDQASYKTSYKRDENGKIVFDKKGQPILAASSDFSFVKLGARDFIEFKMPEKDKRGNLTGRIFEFKLQRSPFDVHIRILGDVVVSYRGEVVRRGQMKILLTKTQE